jgi:hypothetical protein
MQPKKKQGVGQNKNFGKGGTYFRADSEADGAGLPAHQQRLRTDAK